MSSRDETSPAAPSGSKTRRMLALAVVVGGTAIAAVTEVWPFDLEPTPAPRADPSLWHLLLEERVTLGFVRLAVISGCIFAIISVPGLVSERRWIRKFAGLSADDPETVEQLQAQLQIVSQERDEALSQRDEAIAQRDEYRAKLSSGGRR